ncbi:hypothetical protein GcC1_017009 [Golovinomyces cichoracearum]|uniref:Uncharacterized protein n=1 Tax=Golovinomyces cichoracearum TaxID=62708 RepID=A0A420J5S7_9PEZI|nr:hypothetical protein GcC1_017009 [Golovinomyces cichoracearum]
MILFFTAVTVNLGTKRDEQQITAAGTGCEKTNHHSKRSSLPNHSTNMTLVTLSNTHGSSLLVFSISTV